jgi:hypothetical protein
MTQRQAAIESINRRLNERLHDCREMIEFYKFDITGKLQYWEQRAEDARRLAREEYSELCQKQKLKQL